MEMKIFNTLSGQKRIVVFFVMAVLIPSILLGFLAFRGIKNDQALIAQRNRHNMVMAGKQIADDCINAILRAEQDIHQWSYSRNDIMPARPWVHDSTLMAHIASHPCVDNAILFDTSDTPRLQAKRVVFLPDEFSGNTDQHITVYEQQLIEIGWQHEFQARDLRRADQYYGSIIPELKAADAICAALMARARVQKKMKQTERAIATFMQIRKNCSDARINRQIPVRHAAYLELSQLYLESGDTAAAADEVAVLYSNLLENSDRIGQSAFQLVAEKAHNLSDACRESAKPELLSILEKIDSLYSILDIDVRQAEILYALGNKMNNGFVPSSAADGFHRTAFEFNGQRVRISISPRTAYGYCVLILDDKATLDEIVLPSLVRDEARNLWQWRVLDENGLVLRQSADLAPNEDIVTTMISTGAFTWTMQLWQKPVPLIDALIFNGRGIYMLIFFIIMAILIFGFIFTYQAVNSEIRLARMKSSFISTVSHEFKSPLTSIRHMTEILKEGKVQSEARKNEYYSIMLEQSQRLSHLIDNLLDFSKIEEGKKPFHFEHTDIKEFLCDVVGVFEKRISDEDFAVDVSLPEVLPMLSIDRNAMAQVLHNLLDNAYKYSGDSRQIDVTAAKVNGSLRISVRDYGYGIPKAEIP